LERISSLESDVVVYVGLPVLLLMPSYFTRQTIFIVYFAHKDDVIGYFVSWNDNVFVMKFCQVIHQHLRHWI